MSVWLYQINQKLWPPNTFRYEIWQQQRWRWRYGQKRGDAIPQMGDVLVFFYAASGGSDPGIYGWAVVERCDEQNEILYFMPTAPTDHLKMDPWWDDATKAVTDEIRGPMKQATLFLVPERTVPRIRTGIKRWLNEKR